MQDKEGKKSFTLNSQDKKVFVCVVFLQKETSLTQLSHSNPYDTLSD